LKRKQFKVQETAEWIFTIFRAHKGKITFRALSSGLQSFEVSQVFSSVLMLGNTQESALNQPNSTVGDGEFTVKIRIKADLLLEKFDEEIQCPKTSF
jgi:hypothetical protein